MPKIKLTKSTVDGLPLTEKGQKVYFDTEMTGFALLVGRTAKTYVAQRQIGTKTVRVTIGRHGIFTTEEARREARQLLAAMAAGENPNEKRRQVAAAEVTLSRAFDDYFAARPDFKAFTVQTYRRVLDQYLADWRNYPLQEISSNMIADRHRKIAGETGEPAANNAMRIFRAVYNLERIIHNALPPNPVERLTLTRSWYRERRRQTVIKPHELPAWFEAVNDLHHNDGRDFLLLVLFTGMRRSEALGLKWANIDLIEGALEVPETKNGEPLILPLSDFLIDLFVGRQARTGDSPFVFPGPGKTGHLTEPKKFVANVRAASGVSFTLHDLRRTFITVAESLEISSYALKRLLNHKDERDVTSGYIVLSVERLRAPMQKITDQLLLLSKSKSASVRKVATPCKKPPLQKARRLSYIG